jgi:hypothetical protein
VTSAACPATSTQPFFAGAHIQFISTAVDSRESLRGPHTFFMSSV